MRVRPLLTLAVSSPLVLAAAIGPAPAARAAVAHVAVAHAAVGPVAVGPAAAGHPPSPLAVAVGAGVVPQVGPRPRAVVVRARRPHAARYRPPVEAPVRDPFRPPACTWCAGNRGLEYDTAPGQEVVASAPGVVTFAGQVAGRLWVVVGHSDGLRTSYGLLLDLDVAAGRAVRAGERLGSAGDALHFGVRRGDVYLDPATLLGGATYVPRLVPIDGEPSRWPRA